MTEIPAQPAKRAVGFRTASSQTKSNSSSKPGSKPGSSKRPPGKELTTRTTQRPPRGGSKQAGSKQAGNKPTGPTQRSKGRRGAHDDHRDGQRPIVDKAPVWKPGPHAKYVKVEVGMDLAHFVARRAGPAMSVRQSRTLIERGAVRVNGQVETFHSRELRSGDVVEAFIDNATEHTFDPGRVLMDRDGVVAYDKPAWLPVVRPDRKGSWSLLDILRQRWPDLVAVHRLDEDTSGIVLFAKTKPLADRLEKAFKEHAVTKTYLALVRGHPRTTGSHRSYLVMTKRTAGNEHWQSGRGEDAREAVTNWEVLSRVGTYASLVQIKPGTGRHHQIRIHFSEMGYPLYGDRRYGDRRDPIHVARHMLHAAHILLPHPGGGPAIELTAPTPAEFGEAMAILRTR